MLKHGLDQFSLSIMVLGDTLEHNTNYSSNNLPDFVVMEQSYLDNYTLDYNVNRVASSKYESSGVSVNLGEDNPSYNLKREQAFAWDRTHSSCLLSRREKCFSNYYKFMHFSCIFSINRCLVAGNGLVVRGFKSSVINYLNDTFYKPSKIYLNADKDIIIENKNK